MLRRNSARFNRAAELGRASIWGGQMAKSVLSLKRSAIAALALAMTVSPLSVHAQQPAQQPAPGGATNGQAQDMLPAPPASAPTVDTQSDRKRTRLNSSH